MNGDSEPAPRKPLRSDERHAPGTGLIHFIQEAWAELKKVEWPTQKAVISGTAVVLIACVIVGAYLYLNDTVWKYVVQHVLLLLWRTCARTVPVSGSVGSWRFAPPPFTCTLP